MKNLVEAVKGEPRTTSDVVGKELGIAHIEIMRKIKNLAGRGVELGIKTVRKTRGREYTVYSLSPPEKLKLIAHCSSYKSSSYISSLIDSLANGNDLEQATVYADRELEYFTSEARYTTTYFIRNIRTGEFKIGRTTQTPEARTQALQVASCDALELEACIIGDVEQEIHKGFAANRTSGEWFKLTEEDLHSVQMQYRLTFRYTPTFMATMFELWHKSTEGTPEPRLSDFFPDSITSSMLRVAKQSIKKHMDAGEHYKTVYVLVKQDIESFASALMIS